PCKIITQHISDAMYSTINLIYPYMHLLKQKFASTGSNTINDYIDSLYRSALSENMDETDNADSSTDTPTQEIIQTEENKVSYYIYLPETKPTDDLLVW
ncbi:1582_t:CDS:2, partial [Cetraspora pellucida]